MNELHLETSPYLLQHSNNPIYWKAWNEKSLAEARETNKLIIISIGYSACHWCHVMEHESFEDNDVAEVMNRDFISLKVDREERPDVDAIYMKAVQLMTGQGGWPMNAVLLPDGRPVWGGTYFRKNQWIESLKQLQDVYSTNPEKVIEYAEKLMEGVTAIGTVALAGDLEIPSTDMLKPTVEKWSKSFDHEFGGYARAPKFMMPVNYIFLQRYGFQTKSQELLDYIDLTLTKMAYGGLFDTLDGGFSRYSVDMKWHVPHFEKMLYDNGQLMTLYAEAYKRTKNPLYKEVIEKTYTFIQKELTLDNGAFYSALDADSINSEGKLEEGAFYSWRKEELQQLLGEDFDLFARVFNINEFGYWEHQQYVLIQKDSIKAIAAASGISADALQNKKGEWEKLLYREREKRHKPRLEDKTLTSWNALMLKGYADCYKALGDTTYLNAALNNARFITETMWHPEGHLWRTYKQGAVKIKGFLEDYATTADALITLYEATLDEAWLQYAKQLIDYSFENFYDEQQQFFRFTEINDDGLVAAHYETEDNVIPASNSIIANVLYKLYVIYNNDYYQKISLQMLSHIIPSLDYPSAFANWLNLWMNLSADNRELAITGASAEDAVKIINSHYLPHIIIAGSNKPSALALLESRFVKDNLMFYVCKNQSCNLPVSNTEDALKDLEIL